MTRALLLLNLFLAPGVLSQCVYEGRAFNTGERINSTDPCEYCLCYRESVLCLAQPCPPPVQGCLEVAIEGYCCPRYECDTYDIETSAKEATTNSGEKSRSDEKGCYLQGKFVPVGKTVSPSSCQVCECQKSGLKCKPKRCARLPSSFREIEKVEANAET